MKTPRLAASKEGICPTLGRRGQTWSLTGPARGDLHGCLSKGYHSYWDALCFKTAEISGATEKKRRQMITKCACVLQNGAPVRNWHIAHMKTICCRFQILRCPLYSPGHAASEFHSFPTMRSFLKDKHFPDDETLIFEATMWLLESRADFYKWGTYSCVRRKEITKGCVPE